MKMVSLHGTSLIYFGIVPGQCYSKPIFCPIFTAQIVKAQKERAERKIKEEEEKRDKERRDREAAEARRNNIMMDDELPCDDETMEEEVSCSSPVTVVCVKAFQNQFVSVQIFI